MRDQTVFARKNILFAILTMLIAVIFFSCKEGKVQNEISKTSSSEEKIRSLAELQLNYVNTRYQAYFHYGLNSYEDGFPDEHQDWGSGQVAPEFWQPAGLDCEQWAQTVIDGV